MTYETEVLADSPWGFYRQTETTGTTLADASGNSRPLTLNGTAHTLNVAGPVDKAVQWANAAGHAKTAANTIVQPTVGTYEFWIYLTGLPAALTEIMAITAHSGGTGTTMGVDIGTDGKLIHSLYKNAVVSTTASTALTLNTWHHVVASVGAAGTKLRVDKTNLATSATTSVSSFTNASLWVRGGNLGPTGTAAMTIAEPAFYTTQLSDARTDAHYDAGINAVPTAALDVTAAAATGSLSLAVQAVQGSLAVTAPAATSALVLDNTIHTDTSNANNLRQRTMRCGVEITVPVAPVPAGVSEAERHAAIIAYPLPTMDAGRPT